MEEQIDWFDDNYIESKSIIKFLLEKHTLQTKLSINDVFEFCKEIKLLNTDKELLETHIKLLVMLTHVGIHPKMAGEMLRRELKNGH